MTLLMTENDYLQVIELSKNIVNNHLTNEDLNRYYHDSNYLLLVNKDNKEVNSYLIGIKEIDEFEIIELATKENKRRQGIATDLINSIFLIDSTIKTILLEVRSKNIIARNLYSKLGFEVYRVRKNYYGDDDCYCLRKVKDER